MALNEALTMRGEETTTAIFLEGDDRCARLEDVDGELLDITQVAVSTPG